MGMTDNADPQAPRFAVPAPDPRPPVTPNASPLIAPDVLRLSVAPMMDEITNLVKAGQRLPQKLRPD